jgi:hypothetical protein
VPDFAAPVLWRTSSTNAASLSADWSIGAVPRRTRLSANTQYRCDLSSGDRAFQDTVMSPNVPCTRITGTGCAVERHEKSLAPGGAWAWAAPAPASSAAAVRTMARRIAGVS